MDAATELCFTPTIELRRLLRTGELSAVDLVEALLRRIERLNPLLNAYLTVTAEARAMRGEARGLVGGLPSAIKDLEPTAGVRATFGSRWFEHHVPTEDGALHAGNTNTVTFIAKGRQRGITDS